MAVILTEGNDNYTNNTGSIMISALGGNDSIRNSGYSVTIDAGEGDDTVDNRNYSNYTSILGGAGNDSIKNISQNVTIDGGDGNDTISSTSSYVSINGGAGKDLITLTSANGGMNVTVAGGEGDDTIYFYNGGSRVYQYHVGDGNDIIYNATSSDELHITGAEYTTLQSGNDLIFNVEDGSITFKNGVGKSINVEGKKKAVGEYISNSRSNTVIYGTKNDDTITNSGSNVTINGSTGKDSIINNESNVVIDGGYGSDTIKNSSSNVSINGGDGSDTIDNRGENVTITGGAGDDYIVNTGANVSFKYAAGNGNDVITGFDETSTLLISTDIYTYSTQTSGNDLIVTLGENKITLQGAATLVKLNIVKDLSNNKISDTIITGTDENDTFENSGSRVTINSGAGNDTIINSGSNVTIDAGTGSDTISNSGRYTTINGGASDDLIRSTSSYVSINGGTGDDTITNSGFRATINGGEGDDTISNGGYHATIDGGTGNDIITNESDTDYDDDDDDDDITIGASASASAGAGSGSGGSLIKEGNYASINGGEGDDTITNSGSNVIIDGGDGNDSIYNQGASSSIDGGAGNDIITNNGSNVTINGGTGDDTIVNTAENVLFNFIADDGNEVIEGFNATSTLQIGDGTDTYSSLKSGDDIIVTSGTGSVTLKNAATLSSVKIAGISPTTVFGTAKSDYIDNADENVIAILAFGGDDTISNSKKEVYIDGGTGNDTISNSGSNVTINGGTGNDYIYNSGSEVTINGGDGDDTIHNSWNENVTINGGYGNDTITNNGSNVTIDGGAGNDSISNNGENVTINGGEGSDTISNSGRYTTINGGEGNDSIHNDSYGSGTTIDGGAGNDTITNNGSNVTIDGGDGNDTITNNGSNVTIDGGDGNDTITNNGSNVTIDGGQGDDTIFNEKSSVLINGGTGKDLLVNNDNNVTMFGGAGSDTIINNGGNINTLNGGENNDLIVNDIGEYIVMIGGAGSDTISNTGSNVTIDGGADDDTITNTAANVLFNYSADDGNDIIEGFNATSTLSISGGTYSTQMSGADLVITVDEGKGTVTLKNVGMLPTININNDKVIPHTVALNITNAKNDTLIIGTNLDDTIGNSGSRVTINASTGDDNITNTGNNVLFKYASGDGFDVITGFNSTSTLQIGDGTDTYSTTKSADDIIVTSGTGSVTLKNVATLSTVKIYGTEKFTTPTALNINSATDNTLITGTDIDDTITNSGSDVTINGGAGDDFVYNSGFSTKINAGAGSDYISNTGWYATIDGGAGDDEIHNDSDRVSINGSEGTDYIENYGSNVTIDGGAGDDEIHNRSNYVSINAGNDNDTILNLLNSNVTINAGAGADRIGNSGSNIIINAGAGVDTVLNYGDDVSIDGGDGDDQITNNGANVLFKYTAGDGNDTIEGFNTTSTLSIAGGTYTRSTVDNDIVLTVGNGTILLSNASELKHLNIIGTEEIPVPTALNISNEVSNTLITGTDLDDYVENYGSNVTINADAGKDEIYHYDGSDVTINGGDDDDYIENEGGSKVTINAGAGADFVYNSGKTVLIDGGADNDIIDNYGNNVTVRGGAGDDKLTNYGGENVVFEYAVDDGDDVIEGFNATSTLSIADGIYSSKKSDSDVIVTVKDGNITLRGAADLATVNIIGTEENDWSLNDTTAKYGTSTKTLVTVKGVKSLDGISLNGTTVTVKESSLNKTNVTISDGYTLALDGVAAPTTVAAQWHGTTYKSEYISAAGYEVGGNKITYKPTTVATELFSLNGIDSADGFDVSKNGDNYIVNISNLSYDASKTITLDKKSSNVRFAYADNFTGNKVQTVAKAASLNNGTYTSTTYQAWSELDDDVLTIHPATTAKTFTISGLGTVCLGENLIVDGTTVKVFGSALAQKDVSITDGYKLELSNDVTKPSTTAAGWTSKSGTYTYTASKISAGYSLANNKISYVAATGGEQFTISGVKSTSDVSVVNKTVTVGKNSLNGKTVELIGDGYTLALGNDVSLSKTITAGWSGSNGNFTYTEAGTTEGYKLDGKTVTYHTKTGGERFTITGVKDTNGIAFDGKKTVTLSAAALNEDTVTITKGYTLKIDKSVPTSSKTVAATWTKDDDEHTYTASGTPAYYKLSSNKLTFTPAKGGEQFTLTGITSTSGVKVSGKKITLGKKSLGDSDVTFSTEDGFTLALASDVAAAKEIKAGWKKFTYTAEGSTAGYKLNGDKIVYSEQDGGETFTISGLKNINDVTVKDYTVTVGKNSLNGKTVELKGDDFELALAGDVPTKATKESGAFKSCAKGTAIFKTSSYSNDFYTLGDDGKITYTATGGNEIKISGLNPNATLADVPSAIKISDDGGSLKISFKSADVLNNKAPTISAPKGVTYTVAVDKKLSVAEQKSDWTTKGTNATLAADTSATYNVSKNKITCTPKKSGKAQVVLAGLVKDAKLETPDKDKVVTLDADNLGAKSSLKSNADGYKIELTGNMSGKIFVGSANADTIQIAADNALVDGGKGNDEFDISGENVTILSSAGNDTANFADGFAVSLSGTTTVKELAQIDDGVQLTFSNKATLTVTDVDDTFEVVGKKQNFTVDTSKFAVAKNLMFDKNSVTVKADFTGSIEQADDIYTGGKLSTVTTFDASGVTEGISIEGNAKANKIYGGAGDDTLIGGKGNDSLWGGDGQDIFIYDSGDGKDVIFGFSDDDLLEITGNFTTSVNKTGTEIAFKVGSTANAITLKEFTATEFHIGGTTYHISDGKLVK